MSKNPPAIQQGSQTSLFRIGTILKLIGRAIGGPVLVVSSIGFFWFLMFLIVDSGHWKEDARVFVTDYATPITVAVLAGAMVMLISIYREWRTERQKLNEIENFAVLAVLAACAFSVFGAANFWAYSGDPNRYIVDKAFAERLRMLQLQELDNNRRLLGRNLGQLRDDTNTAKNSATQLLDAINRVPAGTVETIQDSFIARWNPFSSDRTGYRLPLPDLKLFLEHEPPQGSEGAVIDERYTLTTSSNRNSMTLGELDTKLGQRLKRTRVRTADLQEALRQTISQWDDKYASALATYKEHVGAENRYETSKDKNDPTKALEIPMSIFIYQSVMEAVGNNPGFIKAMGPLARLISFLHAFMRFLLLGSFLTLFVKGLASGSRQSSGSGQEPVSSAGK